MIYKVVQNSVTVAHDQFQNQGQLPFANAPDSPPHPQSCLHTRHIFKFGCCNLGLTLTLLSLALWFIHPHTPLLHQRSVLLHLFSPSLTLHFFPFLAFFLYPEVRGHLALFLESSCPLIPQISEFTRYWLFFTSLASLSTMSFHSTPVFVFLRSFKTWQT